MPGLGDSCSQRDRETILSGHKAGSLSDTKASESQPRDFLASRRTFFFWLARRVCHCLCLCLLRILDSSLRVLPWTSQSVFQSRHLPLSSKFLSQSNAGPGAKQTLSKTFIKHLAKIATFYHRLWSSGGTACSHTHSHTFTHSSSQTTTSNWRITPRTIIIHSEHFITGLTSVQGKFPLTLPTLQLVCNIQLIAPDYRLH